MEILRAVVAIASSSVLVYVFLVLLLSVLGAIKKLREKRVYARLRKEEERISEKMRKRQDEVQRLYEAMQSLATNNNPHTNLILTFFASFAMRDKSIFLPCELVDEIMDIERKSKSPISFDKIRALLEDFYRRNPTYPTAPDNAREIAEKFVTIMQVLLQNPPLAEKDNDFEIAAWSGSVALDLLDLAMMLSKKNHAIGSYNGLSEHMVEAQIKDEKRLKEMAAELQSPPPRTDDLTVVKAV